MPRPMERPGAGTQRLRFLVFAPLGDGSRGSFNQPHPVHHIQEGAFRGCIEQLSFREMNELRTLWNTVTHVVVTTSKLSRSLGEKHFLSMSGRIFRILNVEDNQTGVYRIYVRESVRGSVSP